MAQKGGGGALWIREIVKQMEIQVSMCLPSLSRPYESRLLVERLPFASNYMVCEGHFGHHFESRLIDYVFNIL